MTALHTLVAQKLGVRSAQSDEAFVGSVERGLPLAAIHALLKGGVSEAEVYRLVLPRRTLAHRRARGECLSREESDRAVRVARITSLAELVFGDREKAFRWMRKPKRRFGGRTPMELLGTEAGARLVEEMINQIDYGLAA